MKRVSPKQLDHITDMLAVIGIVGVSIFNQYDVAIWGLVSLGLGKKIVQK